MIWLDLFCGAGCVADGLIAAGDTVIGVDIRPQPYYSGSHFIQMDCLDFFRLTTTIADWPNVHINGLNCHNIDAIWASPPCLRDTDMRHAPGAKGSAHPELITPTRKWLRATGLPYVLENVEGAALQNPIVLCGSMFGLGIDVKGTRFHLERHRKFETNWRLEAPPHGAHVKPCVTVIGSHARVRARKWGGRSTADFQGFPGGHRLVMGRAFGMPDERKITCKGISDGIPPAYARYIAEQLHKELAG